MTRKEDEGEKEIKTRRKKGRDGRER